jgi:predicted nucleic-acid-binding protein
MLAADTNVLVRLLTNDDPAQATRARAMFEHQTVFVAKTVLLETEWALRSGYGHPRADVIHALAALVGLPNVVLEDETAIHAALSWFTNGMDFADALHLASAKHCEGFATFDRRLARSAPGSGAPPIIDP